MFMLKSLFGKIWGDSNNQELVQIPAGALYLVRPNGPQGSRECIYEDAVLAIRRTSTEHHYQLVVTKAFQDSQPELVDQEDEDLEDERAFLIDRALEFRLSTRGKDRTLVWRDFEGDEHEILEFVIDSKQVNEVTITIFEITFMQCVYEQAFRTTHERATEEDLDKLRYKDEADQLLKRERKHELDKKLQDADVSSTTTTGTATTVSKSEPSAKPAFQVAATVAPAADTAGPQVDDSSVIFSANADLYLYDLKSQYFLVQERKVDVKVVEAGRFLFWLSIHGADKVWLAQKVEADMNMNFSAEQASAVWNYFTDDRQCFSWLLRFDGKEAYDHFHKGFSRVIYETQNEEPWAKAKSDDRAYAETAYEQGEPMDVDEISESEGGDQSVRTAREEEEDDDEEEVAAALQTGRATSEEAGWPEESSHLSGAQDVNSLLAVGYKFDRSFVARGDKIGVFRHTDDNKLEFDTTINNVGTPSGKGFKPLKMMLHNQDAQMVLMDPSNKNAIFNMDLEYGKIVDEWKVHDDVQVNNVVPNSKYAQMTADKTMIGHSHNGIYRIDPRLAGNKLVDSQFKQYASKNDFSVAATDEKGRLAVASNKGDIRLFDSIGKNAKTALPALGDPILGIDVSQDGRYIIATCKTYLLLIDTLIGSGRYQGQLGFDRSFPADAKPQPKRLTLKPSHVAYMGSAISFTPARFNTGSDQETSIVTSTGAYVVSWSFREVKKGNLGSYLLKRYGGEIIQDEHTYGSDQAIVVAFEHDVQMAKRSQLLKPTRKSLAPTGFGRQSR
ncbi:probable VID27 - involved in Vacuole import and degradation [Melanopsichium pennsylvanicum]|uniref:Probable VID27 - involved in Vacuole import and degradation n=2 Tax=Melanopsichium pennsylvanicum TaxID=63383 RepID=A0AAJ5C3Q4_9BASI|nr:probable VID27-involved in Vacuole import and degradation [Melanopsichium pennsylvanicum 4]SNX82709.1 probable VID27 - involved in Vacuole import and degradation [Melanopsichium pennsylvanicum]